eukprot:7525518-Ditylum_brightwellii.AAC.1
MKRAETSPTFQAKKINIFKCITQNKSSKQKKFGMNRIILPRVEANNKPAGTSSSGYLFGVDTR